MTFIYHVFHLHCIFMYHVHYTLLILCSN